MTNVTPTTMRDIRAKEFENAAHHLGVQTHTLGFPDLGLSFLPRETLVRQTLTAVRQKKFDVLFSFHPAEITPMFDHPDHVLVGDITRFVGAAADVAHFMPDVPAMDERPSLYLWTTDTNQATHQLPMSDKTREKRTEYLATWYPSQFSWETKTAWSGIFDHITDPSGTGNHGELYRRVR